MAQKTKEELLEKTNEYCEKNSYKFPEKNVERFIDELTEHFKNVDDANFEDEWKKVEYTIKQSYHFMCGKAAELANEFKEKEKKLINEISELKREKITKTPKDNEDKTKLLDELGVNPDVLKEITSEHLKKKETEKLLNHTNEVIKKAISNVPDGHSESLKKFANGRIFNGDLETDAKNLSDAYIEFIKDSPDVSIKGSAGGGDQKNPMSNLYKSHKEQKG